MSTFSGLNTALTSLVAQRQAIEVAGQNIANVNTVGYTRQRADLQAIEGAAAPSMASAPGTVLNGGVNVASVDRLNDLFLEAKVRQESGSAAYLGAISEALSLVESTIDEPGENGISAMLDTFFNSWADVANRPDDDAARAVLLENARSLVNRIAGGYNAVAAQWDSTRTQAAALVDQVNTAAADVADLNLRIRDITQSGGNPNALIDQRGQRLVELASLVGAQPRERADGTMDVMIGGNALVRGGATNKLKVEGATTLGTLGGPAGAVTGPVRLRWANGNNVGAATGELTGMLAVLAPEGASGAGGPLANLAARYEALAKDLATTVNDRHTLTPGTPGNFFAYDGNVTDGALGLTVAVTGTTEIIAGDPTNGDLDGSIAEAISQIATVGAGWSATVVDLGVQTKSSGARATNAAATLATAEGLLLAQTGVNLDEETVSLVASQRAYEAAARVISAVDQMLDTLINRTGVVGR
ncbi:MAG: flagellar hook-associated protein FlgK [Georgenia sp.]